MVDYDWMRERLEAFRDACNSYERSIPPHDYVGDERLRDQMYAQESTAKTIMKRLDADLVDFNTAHVGGPGDAARSATRALGMLADIQEVETRLRPGAPTLAADEFHPWVWDAARSFWDADAFAVAVEQAAKSVTAHTRQKTGIPLADDDLMAQAWSEKDPVSDRPRLRLPGVRDQTWESRQRGARAMGQACYWGIRNIAAHEHDADWPRQVALEYLAAFSVLARWVDEAAVERAEGV